MFGRSGVRARMQALAVWYQSPPLMLNPVALDNRRFQMRKYVTHLMAIYWKCLLSFNISGEEIAKYLLWLNSQLSSI